MATSRENNIEFLVKRRNPDISEEYAREVYDRVSDKSLDAMVQEHLRRAGNPAREAANNTTHTPEVTR